MGRQYHKAVLFLLTVFLPTLVTSDERFVTCARSAASVCVAYKRLSQNRTLTYTMISLHSCFVAGLTLVYCIWRDSTLFSFDVIEAIQSCLQILTIFGEKWPGAVKYRDIFDAMSQSVFKLAMKPRDTRTQDTGLQPLHLNIGTQSRTFDAPVEILGTGEVLQPPANRHSSNPTMSRLVTEAVKDAFMEVDEEAPGGWQGWRMWNEMITNDVDLRLCPEGTRDVSGGLPDTTWHETQGPAVYAIDPFQDPTLQSSNITVSSQDQWNLSGYR